MPPASTAVHGTPKPRAKPPDSGCRPACVYECDAVTVCPHLSSATDQLGHTLNKALALPRPAVRLRAHAWGRPREHPS